MSLTSGILPTATESTDTQSVSGTSLPADWSLSRLAHSDFDQQGQNLVITDANGDQIIVRGYFLNDSHEDLQIDNGTMFRADWIDRLSQDHSEVAQTTDTPKQSIGTVENAFGEVTVERADGTTATLHKGDAVYQDDVIITGPDASIGILFVDETSFSLSGDGKMILDELVYDPGAEEGTGAISVLNGTFALISGQIAKTSPDALTVKTPSATIGFRGTTAAGQVGDNGETDVVLLPDPNGNVGELSVATEAGFVMLSQANQGTSILNAFSAPTTPQFVSPAFIQNTFGSALSANPSSNSYAPQNNPAPNSDTTPTEAGDTGDTAEGNAEDGEGEAEGEGEANGDTEETPDGEAEGEGEELPEDEEHPEEEKTAENDGDNQEQDVGFETDVIVVTDGNSNIHGGQATDPLGDTSPTNDDPIIGGFGDIFNEVATTLPLIEDPIINNDDDDDNSGTIIDDASEVAETIPPVIETYEVSGSYEGDGGNDELAFAPGAYGTLMGLAGDDTLIGNDGNDELYGGTGNDTLTDYAGVNGLNGNEGNDTIIVKSSFQGTIRGGEGIDTLDLTQNDFGDQATITAENSEITADYDSGLISAKGIEIVKGDTLGTSFIANEGVTFIGNTGVDSLEINSNSAITVNAAAGTAIADFTVGFSSIEDLTLSGYDDTYYASFDQTTVDMSGGTADVADFSGMTSTLSFTVGTDTTVTNGSDTMTLRGAETITGSSCVDNVTVDTSSTAFLFEGGSSTGDSITLGSAVTANVDLLLADQNISDGASLDINYTGVETITLSSGDDVIEGIAASATTVNGGAGVDILYHSGGNITFNGGDDGDEVYIESATATGTFNGGGGDNHLSFDVLSTGVTVSATSVTNGSGLNIAYSDIYELSLSSGDDTLSTIGSLIGIYGNDGDDSFDLSNFANVAGLFAYGGNSDFDTSSDDSASFANDTASLTFTVLSDKDITAEDAGLNQISLSGFEHITGTAHDDTLKIETTLTAHSFDLSDGTDTIVFKAAGDAITLNMSATANEGTGTDGINTNIAFKNAEIYTLTNGADTINAGAINNTVNGGAGDDTFNISQSTVTGQLNGGTHTTGDVLDLSGLGVTTATSGGDYVVVNSETQTVTGYNSLSGVDFAFSGMETLALTDGSDNLSLGSSGNIEYVDAGSGAGDVDMLTFVGMTQGVTVASGAGSNITVDYDGSGPDFTGTNFEVTSGTTYGDTYLGINVDRIYGGDGADTFFTSAYADTFQGSTGADTFLISDAYGALSGADVILGGNADSADDTLSFTSLTASAGDSISIDLTSSTSETHVGTTYDMYTATGTGNWSSLDLKFTEIENYELSAGNDTFIAATGDARVVGGAGNDDLTSGSGADTFVFQLPDTAASFSELTALGLDTINNFAHNDTSVLSDVIAINEGDFDWDMQGLEIISTIDTDGQLDEIYGSATADKNGIIALKVGTDIQLWYTDDLTNVADTDGTPIGNTFQFATLTGAATGSADDFEIGDIQYA